MRPLEAREKKRLYNISKTALFAFGSAMIIYGCWFFISQYISSPGNPGFWFGIFPAYLGSMMILFSIAMKLEWFTDARRFW